MERSQKESLDCKVSVPKKAIQEGGFSDKIQGTDLGGRKADGIEKPRRTTTTDNYIKTLDPQLRQVANVLDEQEKAREKMQSSTIGSTI